MIDDSYRILDSGCWMLDTGCWILDAGCWNSPLFSIQYQVLVSSIKVFSLSIKRHPPTEILYLMYIFHYMTESGFLRLKAETLQLLEAGLDPRLSYHSTSHTRDVMQQAGRIAAAENITDPRMLLLLQVASLFHDTGFLYTYKDHEKRSCEMMEEALDKSLFSDGEITRIKDMIMATRIPQSPLTLSEMIICDADLDYLGREDFEMISERLRMELMNYGFIKSDKEWNLIQVNFFERHRYFTVSSQRDREPGKIQSLEKLRLKI